MARVAVLGGDVYFPVTGDGVRDYAQCFTEALQRTGLVTADLFWWSRSGMWTHVPGDPQRFRSGRLSDIWPILPRFDAVIVQYDVFRYGRRGFVPWLPARLLHLKRRAPHLRIAVMLHELHLPFHTWRWEIKKGWQRVQHVGFRLAADVLFCSVEAWVDELQQRMPQRPVVHLPVGSNLPDRRHTREWERVRLGADGQTLVVASFGTDDSPWRLYDYTTYALNRMARAGHRVLFLNLGGNTPILQGIDEAVRAIRPGFLSNTALAEMIAASDLLLAPLADGVSTRRTTAMAAFQQAVPVLGTCGSSTDGVLRTAEGALRLVPVRSPTRFGDAAVCLAGDADLRRRMGEGGRELYQRSFDWPITAVRALSALGLAHAAPSNQPDRAACR